MTTQGEMIAPPPSGGSPAAKKGSERPGEWRSEQAVKGMGKIPAAAGRGLDRLAKLPMLGAVVRFFSSVWVGIGWLFLLQAIAAFALFEQAFRNAARPDFAVAAE